MSTNLRILTSDSQESGSTLAGSEFQNGNANALLAADSPLETSPLELSFSLTSIEGAEEESAEHGARTPPMVNLGAEVSTSRPADATSLSPAQPSRFAVSCVDLGRLISSQNSSNPHASSSDVSHNPMKKLEQSESGPNGRISGRAALGHWATAPLPPANAPTTAAPRVPPFPMLGAIRARENILVETDDVPHKPGYATPMRTSVVELFPARGSSSGSEGEDSLSTSPSGPHSPTHVNFPTAATLERLYASRFETGASNSPSSNSPLSDSDSCTTDSFDSLHDGSSFLEGSRSARPSTSRESRKMGLGSSPPTEHATSFHTTLHSANGHATLAMNGSDPSILPTPHSFGDHTVSTRLAGATAGFGTAHTNAASLAAPAQGSISSTTQAPSTSNSSLEAQCALLPGHDHVFGSPAFAITARQTADGSLQVGASPSGSPSISRNIEHPAAKTFAITSRNALESGVSASTSFEKKNTPSVTGGSSTTSSGPRTADKATLNVASARPVANTNSSAQDAAVQPTPTVLMQKPKLVKHRSAMDSLTSTSPPSSSTHKHTFLPPTEVIPKKVNDPFADMKPHEEVAWSDIIFDTSSPCLGDGNEGDVLLARVRDHLVAVKMGDNKRILKEQKVIAELSHPHILRTIGFAKRDVDVVRPSRLSLASADGDAMFSSSESDELRDGAASTPSPVPVLRPAGAYAAIYEYCANKDLMTYLSVSDARNDVAKMTQIFDDILAGLEYIHDPKRTSSAPIVHGDVKPENIMIDSTGRAKLGDFGLAQTQADNMDVQGTPSYIAPEVVLDFLAGSSNPNFTTKADMFSFGVLMVVALTGHYPFKRLTAKLHSGQMSACQVIKHFTPSRRALKTISDLSPRFKRMVDSCLCRYPEMRPSATQLRKALGRQSAATQEAQRETAEGTGGITIRATASRAEAVKIPLSVTVSPPGAGAGAAGAAGAAIASESSRNSTPAALAMKVPSSLAHLVLGPAATPSTAPALMAIPVSSGKFSD